MGTLREPCGTLGTFGTLGTLREPWDLGNLYLGTFTWEPLLGNLYLGTFNWEPLLGNLGTWEPLTGNLYLGTWEPLLGNLYLEPGNLGGMGFGAAPVCSETFTMAEDPKASAVGEKMCICTLHHSMCRVVINLRNVYLARENKRAHNFCMFVWITGIDSCISCQRDMRRK